MQTLISTDNLERVRREFLINGLTVKDWASEHQYPAPLVYAVLSGRAKARRGKSHQIAIALGLLRPTQKDHA